MISVRSRLRWLLPWLVLPSLVVAQPWPEPPERIVPAPEIWERLQAGEVVLKSTHVDESGGAARVQALFELQPEALWDVIRDCEANFRFVDGLRECEVVSESTTSAVTRQQVKKGFFSPRLDYSFETVREPHEWIRIQLLEGDLKLLEGSWRFDPAPEGEGLLVTHEIRVRPRMPVPRWLVRRTVRKDISDMVACLRWEAGGSLDPKQRGLDRERCPD